MNRATLLLLPGNMCDARLWEPLRARLDLATWQVATPVMDAATIGEMAAALLDAHPGPLLPIGFSMGGIVALELARRARDRIVGLGLLDTNAAADLPERAAQRPRQQRAVREGRLEQIVVEELKPNYLAAANRGEPTLLRLLRDMALTLGPDVFVRQSEALRTRADLSAVLPDLRRPIFLACGEEDALCPPEWHRALAASAPGAELHVIDGAGHMLPLEQPAALAERLAPWLQKVIDPCLTAS